MPQIAVDHSASLTDVFDRRGFALALHPLIVEMAKARTEDCKTLFRTADETVVGATADGHAVLRVTIDLLKGRTDETKAALARAVLELVRDHAKPSDGLVLHASVEVRDLDASYRKDDGI